MKVGDIVIINNNCRCKKWIGQKRKVTMVLDKNQKVFAARIDGSDEHLFRQNECDLFVK